MSNARGHYHIIFRYHIIIWFSLPISKLKERVKRILQSPSEMYIKTKKKSKKEYCKAHWRWYFLYFTKAKYSSHRCTETLPSGILPPSGVLDFKISGGACPRTPLKWSRLRGEIERDHYLKHVSRQHANSIEFWRKKLKFAHVN